MTASFPSGDLALDRPAPAEHVVRLAVDDMTPVGLDAVTQRAELLTRVDRKYFVPATLFSELAGQLAGEYGVLDIGGLRLFDYESTYFDTPDLLSYRHHLQGRRRRFKVRVRAYVDNGDSMLEVKLKGHRGATVKHRTPHTWGQRRVLTPDAYRFVADVVADAYSVRLRRDLVPTVITTNRRATLASVEEGSRVTCDVGVACRDGRREVRMNEDVVLVETKAGPEGSAADRWIRKLGLRPVSVSKYCAGIALLRTDVPSNPWHRVLRRHFDAPIASLALPSAVS